MDDNILRAADSLGIEKSDLNKISFKKRHENILLVVSTIILSVIFALVGKNIGYEKGCYDVNAGYPFAGTVAMMPKSDSSSKKTIFLRLMVLVIPLIVGIVSYLHAYHIGEMSCAIMYNTYRR